MASAAPKPILRGDQLQPLLNTTDFDQWRSVVGSNLGNHSSDLLGPPSAFSARMRFRSAGELALLHMLGTGAIRLNRIQSQAQAVLWIPLQGVSHEVVNGDALTAEPGMAMLLRPGDRLEGHTSRQLEGLSILLPAARIQAGLPTLLHRGEADQALIGAARRFAELLASAAEASADAAAAALCDAMESWQMAMEAQRGGRPERITAIRRRQYVSDGCLWMADQLEQPFEISALAKAVGVSARTLQYAFLQELGCTPMAEAKRQRLHRLRQLLQDPEQCSRSVAELMGASGLLVCGATAGDYRRRFGESPRQTRAQ